MAHEYVLLTLTHTHIYINKYVYAYLYDNLLIEDGDDGGFP